MFFRRRRRNPLSALSVIVIALAVVGYEMANQALVRRQAYEGTLVKRYDEAAFLSRRGRRNHYWDVRTPDGSTRSARVYSTDVWHSAEPGDWVRKSAGDLDPHPIGH